MRSRPAGDLKEHVISHGEGGMSGASPYGFLCSLACKSHSEQVVLGSVFAQPVRIPVAWVAGMLVLLRQNVKDDDLLSRKKAQFPQPFECVTGICQT